MRRAFGLGLFCVLALTGCTEKKIIVGFEPPSSSPRGKSSYTYIFDPSNPALGLPDDVQFVRPMAIESKTLPKYPERALAARDGPHLEVVRFIIDTKGNVEKVLDSPLASSDGGPFAADYRRAVEEALKSWHYQPGMLQHVEPGEDKDGDGKPDYKVMKSSEAVAVYYDVRFTFEIVEGKGVVKTTP